MADTPDPDEHRPAKRRALSPASRQAATLDALFKNPAKALSSNEGKTHAPNAPPEIVTNVQGSSAGAGSGEFFVYKAARRREYERLAAMDEESAKELADAEWERAKAEREAKDKVRGSKNRARRDKAKMKREGKGGEEKKKRAAAVPIAFGTNDDERDEDGAKVVEAEGLTIHDD